MKNIGTRAIAAPPTANRLPLYALILYDDRPAYRSALRVLVSVNRQLDDDLVEIRPLPWRLDDVAKPGLREIAAQDVRRAQILILTDCAGGTLTVGIQRWLQECLAQRSNLETAIVSLSTETPAAGRPASAGSLFARRTAAIAGCELIEATRPDAPLASARFTSKNESPPRPGRQTPRLPAV